MDRNSGCPVAILKAILAIPSERRSEASTMGAQADGWLDCGPEVFPWVAADAGLPACGSTDRADADTSDDIPGAADIKGINESTAGREGEAEAGAEDGACFAAACFAAGGLSGAGAGAGSGNWIVSDQLLP